MVAVAIGALLFNHWYVNPVPVFALITTLSPVHNVDVVAAVAVAIGNAFTVAATDILVAVVHPFAVASTK